VNWTEVEPGRPWENPMVRTGAAGDSGGMPLQTLRYGIPLALIVGGFVLLFAVDDDVRWDGWAMLVGSGLSVLLLNVLFRLGVSGDKERDAEEAAREYFAAHGHWPDEKGD
jgi:hypothetical protein